MNIVFMGTAEFSVIVLDKLFKSNHKIVGVVSQPNREKDKKGNVLDTPVKKYALSNSMPLFQFERVSNNIEILKSLKADIFITAAYGQLLSQEVINIPKYGILNTHASILPKYRGSSPIQAAIKNGDYETGVTIMRTDLSMDTGDIVDVVKTKITDSTTSGQLEEELAKLAGDKLCEVLEKIDYLKFVKQNHDEATYTKKIKKSDALMDWNKSAFSLLREVNAFNPAPISYFIHRDKNIKVFSVEVAQSCDNVEPGTVLMADGKSGFVVACGEGALKINTLQAPSKNILKYSEFLKGYKFVIGEKIS